MVQSHIPDPPLAKFLFAGTVSINPIMFVLELFLILAWRVAGWYGLDRFILPLLGAPWQPGQAFKKKVIDKSHQTFAIVKVCSNIS